MVEQFHQLDYGKFRVFTIHVVNLSAKLLRCVYPYATHRKLVADCEREGRSVRKFWSFTDETVEFEASIRKTALITDRTLFFLRV